MRLGVQQAIIVNNGTEQQSSRTDVRAHAIQLTSGRAKTVNFDFSSKISDLTAVYRVVAAVVSCVAKAGSDCWKTKAVLSKFSDLTAAYKVLAAVVSCVANAGSDCRKTKAEAAKAAAMSPAKSEAPVALETL